jgi:hypothetical protein
VRRLQEPVADSATQGHRHGARGEVHEPRQHLDFRLDARRPRLLRLLWQAGLWQAGYPYLFL